MNIACANFSNSRLRQLTKSALLIKSRNIPISGYSRRFRAHFCNNSHTQYCARLSKVSSVLCKMIALKFEELKSWCSEKMRRPWRAPCVCDTFCMAILYGNLVWANALPGHYFWENVFFQKDQCVSGCLLRWEPWIASLRTNFTHRCQGNKSASGVSAESGVEIDEDQLHELIELARKERVGVCV